VGGSVYNVVSYTELSTNL